MEAALQKALGIAANLVKGDRGIFEVRADSELIYSKKACGDKFPTHQKIISLLRARQNNT